MLARATSQWYQTSPFMLENYAGNVPGFPPLLPAQKPLQDTKMY